MRLCAIVMFATLAVVPAYAADAPHVVDFTLALSGPTGEVLKGDCGKAAPDGHCLEQKALTLGDAAAIALEAQLDGDPKDGAAKFARDQLARKIYENKAATLSVDDLALIKDRIGKAFGASVVGAAWPLLDPALAK